MVFQPVLATAEAVIVGAINLVQVTMTFYARRAVYYDQEQIDQLAGGMDGWFSGSILPSLASDYSYFYTSVKGLELQNDFQAIDASGAGPGGDPNQPPPNNVAYCVKRVSGLTGRSARGRVYVPAIPRSELTANENYVTATWRDSIVANFNNIQSNIGPLGWQEVIVSRYSNGVQRPNFAETFDIAEWTYTDSRVDTQRRRLPASQA